MTHSAFPPGQTLARKFLICEMLGISPGGLAKLAKRDPTFPKPIKSSSCRQGAAFYVVAEVEAWLETRKAARGCSHE